MPGSSIFSINNTNFANRITPPVVAPPTQPSVMLPQCNLIWKTNVEEVLGHPKAPNETLYFGCSGDDPVIWVRETDGNGQIKNPLHKLTYTVEEVPFGPEAQFVTKAEHQQLFDLVQSVSQKLDKFEELFK